MLIAEPVNLDHKGVTSSSNQLQLMGLIQELNAMYSSGVLQRA